MHGPRRVELEGGVLGFLLSDGVRAGRIVALSEETVKHLKRGKAARDHAGKARGLVRGKDRRIAHVMRFDQAGAKAVVASNAATLAMTAAVSQQLASIEQQLTEIRDALDEMMEDADIERLGDVIGTNEVLQSIARDINRRGYMTQADQNRLSDVSLEVSQNASGAQLKTTKLLSELDSASGREKRVEQLEPEAARALAGAEGRGRARPHVAIYCTFTGSRASIRRQRCLWSRRSASQSGRVRRR